MRKLLFNAVGVFSLCCATLVNAAQPTMPKKSITAAPKVPLEWPEKKKANIATFQTIVNDINAVRSVPPKSDFETESAYQARITAAGFSADSPSKVYELVFKYEAMRYIVSEEIVLSYAAQAGVFFLTFPNEKYKLHTLITDKGYYSAQNAYGAKYTISKSQHKDLSFSFANKDQASSIASLTRLGLSIPAENDSNYYEYKGRGANGSDNNYYKYIDPANKCLRGNRPLQLSDKTSAMCVNAFTLFIENEKAQNLSQDIEAVVKISVKQDKNSIIAEFSNGNPRADFPMDIESISYTIKYDLLDVSFRKISTAEVLGNVYKKPE